MNVRNGLCLLLALAAAAAALPASAQVRTRRGGGEYRPLPPRRDWQVRPAVDRAERQSNAFRHWYEKVYARRGFHRDGDARDFKHDIQDMDEAMERLRHKADDRRPGVGRGELQDALRHARDIDREIGRDRDTRFTYREWQDLRDTLNDLARIYDLRGV